MDHVVAELVENERRIRGESLLSRRDDRQFVVVDHDQLAGVLSHITAFRHHKDDRVSYEPNLVAGEGLVDRRAMAFDLKVEVERLCEAFEVRGRVDGDHTRKGARGLDVHGHDPRVCEGAPDERGVHHPGQDDVVDIAAAADQDAPVLDPFDAAADELPNHRGRHAVSFPVSLAAARLTPSMMLW